MLNFSLLCPTFALTLSSAFSLTGRSCTLCLVVPSVSYLGLKTCLFIWSVHNSEVLIKLALPLSCYIIPVVNFSHALLPYVGTCYATVAFENFNFAVDDLAAHQWSQPWFNAWFISKLQSEIDVYLEYSSSLAKFKLLSLQHHKV